MIVMLYPGCECADPVRKPDEVRGLLDYVSRKLGCTYLSDLHRADPQPLYQILRKIQEQAYPLRDWNDAVIYLTGRNIVFRDSEEARKNLLDYLNK